MAAPFRRMEESLHRTSELAREVLQRARRREVDWWGARRHERTRHRMEPTEDDDGSPITLEEAFTTMSHFMHHTTEQCKAYHSCALPRGINEQEKQHIGRFHHGRSPQAAQRPESHLISPSAHLTPSAMKIIDPQDVYIEVAPGTYCISSS